MGAWAGKIAARGLQGSKFASASAQCGVDKQTTCMMKPSLHLIQQPLPEFTARDRCDSNSYKSAVHCHPRGTRNAWGETLLTITPAVRWLRCTKSSGFLPRDGSPGVPHCTPMTLQSGMFSKFLFLSTQS